MLFYLISISVHTFFTYKIQYSIRTFESPLEYVIMQLSHLNHVQYKHHYVPKYSFESRVDFIHFTPVIFIEQIQ